MRSFSLLALTGLLTLAAATPVTPPLPHALPQVQPIARQSNGANSTAPCAQVSQALYGDGAENVKTRVPAKLAYDCINSVPLNATNAKMLVHGLRPYLEWQSTINVLKNPPAEYAQKVQPPVDILGGLDMIAADIDAGNYENEYEFGWSLYTLFLTAHDGHFYYIPDVVANIFNFGRPIPLVSVSEDGQKLPSVFAFTDVLGSQFKNISYTPSPVTQIDGQDVNTYLEKLSQSGSSQDRDALYNNLFYELAQISQGTSGSGTGLFTGGGRGRFVYPGATTTLKFANGTSYTMENYARVLVSLRGIDSGEKLAERFFYEGFTGQEAQVESNAADTVSAAAVAAAASAPGYPAPVVAGPDNTINGFYVNGPGYEDVAVLQVPNFVGSQTTSPVMFQKATQRFIPQAVAAGKTKLIIDLQANGGGTILEAYDMFKQLFPSADPYGANRFRAHEALDLIGQAYSAKASQAPRDTNATLQTYQGSVFDYHTDMNVFGKPFDSWPEKFGPHNINGENYNTLMRWNLSDPLIDYFGGINITGYGPLANASSAAQPFKAENIVILTDGYCASTCTIFSEFLTKQAGVKTIAIGGRSNKNQIQAIGGVKGVNNYQWSLLQSFAQAAVRIAPDNQKAKFNNSVLSQYTDDVPFNRAAAASVNFRDGLRFNDNSGVPLQFIYENADCRIYYTPEMTVDATAMWKVVADAKWGKNGKCVQSIPTYGQDRRTADQVTTRLSRRRVQVSSAAALRQFETFEKTFELETVPQPHMDGFMQP